MQFYRYCCYYLNCIDEGTKVWRDSIVCPRTQCLTWFSNQSVFDPKFQNLATSSTHFQHMPKLKISNNQRRLWRISCESWIEPLPAYEARSRFLSNLEEEMNSTLQVKLYYWLLTILNNRNGNLIWFYMPEVLYVWHQPGYLKQECGRESKYVKH